jgi:tRNA (mo5U34)-methyltransferase
MSTAVSPNDARAEHIALTRAFEARCAELALRPDPLFFWYHTIELDQGLVTPGSFDYRAQIDEFGFPASLSGMTALDVGSATGFFAFELERRGARVVSTELPALSRWDCFPGESPSGIIEKIRERLPYHSLLPYNEIAKTFHAMSEDALYRILLDGPFHFCHQRLGSRVERVYSTIYELGTMLPGRGFDLVMLGDILLHTVDPLRALASAAGMCDGELIIADDIGDAENDPPAMLYVGGASPDSDMAEWWRPNGAWFRQTLARLGFRQVDIGAPFQGSVRPGGETHQKRIIHAKR